MNWKFLQLGFNKLSTSALFALAVVPVVADMGNLLGVDTAKLKIPILGGLVYVFAYLAFKFSIPKTIEDCNKETFVQRTIQGGINLFQLACVSKLDANSLKKKLGDDALIFFPIENGLIYARERCILIYVSIEFDLLNESKMVQRYLVAAILVAGITMTNWLSIARLIRVLGA